MSGHADFEVAEHELWIVSQPRHSSPAGSAAIPPLNLHLMLYMIVSLKSVMSWGTTAMCSRSDFRVTCTAGKEPWSAAE